jgi:serine/threonine protein kinase
MKVILTVTDGPHHGRSYEFEEHDTFIVGRAKDAHFRLPVKDKAISRFHFLVEVNPPSCRLMDMASTNGTIVNGRMVQSIDLEDRDVIVGGRTTFVVSIEDEDPSSHSVAPVTNHFFDTIVNLSNQPPSWRMSDESTIFSLPGYRIERELGRGGMGVVYLAHAEAGGSPVAIKTITPKVDGSDAALARFLREAKILRQLDHPNIVGFESIGHHQGRFYFAMEYVQGIDAAESLKQAQGPLPISRAVSLACQTLDALAYAHALGFVHRDIKPNNLLVATIGNRETMKLADFGLARVYQTSPISGLTLAGHFGGAAGFLAPEQITNFRQAKPSSDLYAVGATLYFLLTANKTHDFSGGFEQQLLMVLQEEPVPIRDRRPEIPEALAEVIHRSLAKDPANRFPDALAMRVALSPFGRRR